MSKKDDVAKYIKIVNSCQNPEQLTVAQNFAAQVYAKYGEGWWLDGSCWRTPFLDMLVDIQNKKAEKLKHERKVRIGLI
jgi:hypothetical protein